MSVGVLGRSIAAPAADAARVAAIRNNLDVKDTGEVAAFGERARKEVLASVERLLAEVRSNDAAEALDLVGHCRERIDGLHPADLEPRGGFDNLFNGRTARLHRMRRAADQVGQFVGDAASDLAERTQRLQRKTEALNSLHEQARAFILELDAYLEAGRARLAEARASETAQPEPVHDPEPADVAVEAPRVVPDAGAAARLEARLADLESARAASLQQLPLVRMVQNTDGFLAEALDRAQQALAKWRTDWRELLGASAGRRFRPHVPALADAKLAALTALSEAATALQDGKSRRAEAEDRMEKVAEAVRSA